MKYTRHFFVSLASIIVFVPSFTFAAPAKSTFVEQKPEKQDYYFGPTFATKTKGYALFGEDDIMPLAGKNMFEQRPIASLTKLMTAMVALDHDFNFEGSMRYNPDRHYAYRNYMNFQRGEVIANKDLWYSMLTGSMNIPARMIVDSLGMTDEHFVAEMNHKAMLLGLPSTQFEDMHGLSEKNVSTAYDVGLLLRNALKYPEIRHALSTDYYEFDELVSRDKRVHHSFTHTDVLRKKNVPFEIVASKTGYTYEAGPCIATEITDGGTTYIVVTLGEYSYAQRHQEITKLVRWWDFSRNVAIR